jgi:hypothetical protein
MYYKPSGRRSVNRTYGAPMYARNQNFGVKVEHDNWESETRWQCVY